MYYHEFDSLLVALGLFVFVALCAGAFELGRKLWSIIEWLF